MKKIPSGDADALVDAVKKAEPGETLILSAGVYNLGTRSLDLNSVSLISDVPEPQQTMITAEAPPNSFYDGQILRVRGKVFLQSITVKALTQQLSPLGIPQQPNIFQYPIFVADHDAVDLFVNRVNIEGTSDALISDDQAGRVRVRANDCDWRSIWDVVVTSNAPGSSYTFTNSRFTGRNNGILNVATRIAITQVGVPATFFGCEINSIDGMQGSYGIINRGTCNLVSCKFNVSNSRNPAMTNEVFNYPGAETCVVKTTVTKVYGSPVRELPVWDVNLSW